MEIYLFGLSLIAVLWTLTYNVLNSERIVNIISFGGSSLSSYFASDAKKLRNDFEEGYGIIYL